jgi:hypothetical protein
MSDAFADRMAAMTGGGQLAVQGEYAPVFMLKPGMYPATIISIEGPWPRKPAQYYPKGDMRLSFRLRLDGLEGLLKEAGIEMPPPERMYWYDPQVSYHYPLKDTHPPTFIGDEVQAWTKDDSKVAEYFKPWSKTAAFEGRATIYGAFQEAGAINFNDKGEEFVDFGQVIGARVYAVYTLFDNDSTKSWVSKIMGHTAPKTMRDALDRDPSLNKLTVAQCLHLNNWPRPKDQDESSSAVTPMPSQIEWFAHVVRANEANSVVMDSIKIMVQKAAQSCGAAESRFSCLLGPNIHGAVLQDIAQLLGENALPMPQLPAEGWAAPVASRYTAITSQVGLQVGGSVI